MLGVITKGSAAAASAGAAYYAYKKITEPPDPYKYQLVTSSSPSATPPAVLKRGQADLMLGSQDSMYLGATWLYDKPLDAEAIKVTLGKLVTKMPVLAGRRVGDGIVLSNEGARFSVYENCPGSAHDYAST